MINGLKFSRFPPFLWEDTFNSLKLYILVILLLLLLQQSREVEKKRTVFNIYKERDVGHCCMLIVPGEYSRDQMTQSRPQGPWQCQGPGKMIWLTLWVAMGKVLWSYRQESPWESVIRFLHRLQNWMLIKLKHLETDLYTWPQNCGFGLEIQEQHWPLPHNFIAESDLEIEGSQMFSISWSLVKMS